MEEKQLSNFTKRERDELGFWTSKGCLYWHFWKQSISDKKQIKEILNNYGNLLKDNSVVEFGFGTGRNYRYLFRGLNWTHYTGVEPNKYLCEQMSKRIKDKDFKIVNQSAQEFLKEENKFDVLITCGAVFMYMTREDVDWIFKRLRELGVKTVIILSEGGEEDCTREDGTTMYDFKTRLKKNYPNKNFVSKLQENKGIYDYFVML